MLILAGGRATRMGGGDKGLRPFGGATLLDRVAARLAGQGAPLLLNANGDPGRFARFNLPVAPDTMPDQPGPLAGVLAGLDWLAAQRPEIEDLVTVPADTPFVPRDLVARLRAARDAADAALALAASNGRTHPVCALWPVRLRGKLRDALGAGLRRVNEWAGRYPRALAEYGVDPIDPFLNVNTPEDLARAAALADAYPEA